MEELVSYYEQHQYISQCEKEGMMREWTLFRQKLLKLKGVHDQSDAKSSSADLYGETLREKDDELENIDILIKLMMTISPSTAACERGFSSMNREEIKSRCNLAQQTLEDMMHINIDGPSLKDYNPLTPLQTWLNEGKGAPHLNHTTGYKKKPKNKDLAQLEPVVARLLSQLLKTVRMIRTSCPWKSLKVQY